MPLQKMKFDLSIIDGVDTKTDSKNVVPTKFLAVENMAYTKTGSLIKRFGGLDLSNKILSTSTAITSAKGVSSYEDELLLYTANGFFTYTSTQTRWVQKGAFTFAVSDERPIVTTGFILSETHTASEAGFKLVVFASSNSVTEIQYRIIDEETGTTVASGNLGAGQRPRAEALAGSLYIIYDKGTSIVYRRISVSTPATLGAETTLTAKTLSAGLGTAKVGNKIFISTVTSSNELVLLQWGTDGVVQSPTSVKTGMGSFEALHIELCIENTDYIRVVVAGTSTVGTRLYPYGGYFASSPYVSFTDSAANITTAATVWTGTQSILYYNSIPNASPFGGTSVLRRSIDLTTGAFGAVTTVLVGMKMVSAPVSKNGIGYFGAARSVYTVTDSAASTLFLFDHHGSIIAKWEDDNAATNVYDLHQTKIIGETIVIPFEKLADFQSVADKATGTLIAATTVADMIADFSPAKNFFDASLGQNLHVAGGILRSYDGTNLVEHGFLEVPPTPVLVANSTATGGPGMDPNALYQYVVVYAWRDKYGQVHRSAPSIPMSVTTVTPASGQKPRVTVRIFPTPLTVKTGVEIEIYRTQGNGDIFYKRGGLATSNYYLNDKTLKYIDVADSEPDSDAVGTGGVILGTIGTGETLYTTGGVLDNIAVPSSTYVTSHKNRLWAITDGGYKLSYSKLREDNGPVEFNDSLYITLDRIGGPATSVMGMDNNLIVFKERALSFVSGEGPNNLGGDGDYGKPVSIVSDVGCTEPASLIQTPMGLMFKSEKGIYMLSRQMSVQYIGAPVERFNSLAITSAVLMADTNEVRFTTEGGITLVFDYFHQRWAWNTNQEFVDAVVHKAELYAARPDGLVRKENKTTFLDGDSPYKAKIETAWVALKATNAGAAQNLSGYQRFYKLMILGNFKANHKLRVQFSYDYDDAILHESIIDAGTLLATTAYSEGAYGAGHFGGDFKLYQFEVFPKLQRCQAFKVTISDVSDASAGEAFTISNLSIELGMIAGVTRKTTSRTSGAK